MPQEFQSLESLKGLVNLQDLEIPDGYRLSNVSSSLCSDCPKLKMPAFIPSIETDGIFHTIPTEDKSIQSALVLYGAQALSPGTFQNCKNLTKVWLADSLQGVGEKAFSGCAELTSLTLPDSLQSIGEEAFSYCSSLTSITLPASLQSIGSCAFSGCTKLNQLYGSHQISQLNENVFENCPELGVIQIFSYDDQKVMAGSLKDNLQTALVLQGAESIGEEAFCYCSSLTSIILPASLQSIGDYAFKYCSSLTSIALPASLQTIGTSAFYGCSKLVKIDVSKITLSVTNSIDWNHVFYDSEGRDRVTKIICRREQSSKMKSVFTKATLVYVD